MWGSGCHHHHRGRSPRIVLVLVLVAVAAALFCSRGAYANSPRGTNPRQAVLGRTTASATLTPRPAIVGGADAPQHRLTHQVALAWDSGSGPRLYCGGSLIREDVVLTASHCDPWMSDVVIPGTYTNQDGPAGADWAANGMHPRLIVKHPAWDPYTMAGDATLVFLDGCAALGPATSVVQLATAAEFAAAAAGNADFVISGWGTTSAGAGGSGAGGITPVGGRLQYGITKYVPTASCSLINTDPTSVSDFEFCAGGVPAMGNDNTPPYQDTCQGDSGGPVIFNLASPTNVLSGNNSDDRLAGITSWGQGCGLANLPGVYTRVPYVLSWIQEQLAAHPRTCDGPTPPNDGGNNPPGPPQQPPPDWPPQWPPFFPNPQNPNPQNPPPTSPQLPPSPPTGGGGGPSDPGSGGGGGGTDAQQPSNPQCASAEEDGAGTASWYGRPKYLLLRGANADADAAPDACCDACLAKPTCVAYSVTVKVTGGKERRTCAFYAEATRLCTADDRATTPVCKRTSEGSYVIVARRRRRSQPPAKVNGG